MLGGIAIHLVEGIAIHLVEGIAIHLVEGIAIHLVAEGEEAITELLHNLNNTISIFELI